MTYLRKNKLELIGHKTCKSMPDALKMKKKKKQKLGRKSALEVYFGRKSKEMLWCGKSIEKDREPDVQP